MTAVVVVLAILAVVQAGVIAWFGAFVMRENRRLVNLAVAQHPREFAALERAAEPPPVLTTEPAKPSILNGVGPTERLVGSS